MRILRAGIPVVITIALVWLLDHPLGSLPALGRLLDPVNGWAASAEPVNKTYTSDLKIKGLRAPVTVWLEDRLVPHIKADNDHDLYLAEGYIHAYFRLWQMDMQTRAAGGRVSEVIGEKGLKFDRTQRRKGMVYAAENSLKAIEAEPRTKEMLDAYTEGVNTYIHSLNYRDLPLEYKLMGFTPEDWTSLKCALLMKYMADDLTGYTEDFPLTYLRDKLPKDELDKLFPEKIPGYKPVIPGGTKFAPASLAIPPVPGIPDSLFAHFREQSLAQNQHPASGIQHPESIYEPDGTGSNNWAISGSLTTNKAPILCNDPHLGLNLPSLWFEAQLQAPGINSYGVTLPGAPGVVIGFNDSVSWGFTNNYRDVKDFYLIDAVNNGNEQYWFDGKQTAFKKRIEQIKIKGAADYNDTVLYTVHGPVMYDEHFEDPAKSGRKIAMTWMAHRATNELLSLYLVNRAENYDQFVAGIMHFECPAQNMIYADRAGNIAIWGQGQFINKWRDQGKYVMEGRDSRTIWGQNIPMAENPHVINPPQGYLASANQAVTDDTYPYWYNGHFLEFRSWEINEMLSKTANRRILSMWEPLPENFEMPLAMNFMQNSTYSLLASRVSGTMDTAAGIQPLRKWCSGLDFWDSSATRFQVWWSELYADIWKDDFSNVPENLWPTPEVTMQLILNDSASKYYDDIKTSQKETLRDIVKRSYKEALDSLDKLKKSGGIEWYEVKNTTVAHLTKLPAFSYDHLKIGGWGNTINAAKKDHGPSWRMIVEMGRDSITGFGIYPGGQSGNPGSKHYADFLGQWVEGKYNHLLFLPSAREQKRKELVYTWTLQSA
ncbi:penicillin acylase family protein [Chitinophagaceae bacterium MMS25-I14]